MPHLKMVSLVPPLLHCLRSATVFALALCAAASVTSPKRSPALRPPRFRCDALEAGCLRLHYWSERRGFAPMIIGLVEGLAERYKLVAEVIHDQQRGAEHDHDSFMIRLSEMRSDAS